jgi:hypothetical protein
MTVRFDPDTARLRLDPGAFDALCARISDSGEPADQLRIEELRNCGVLRGGAPHPTLAEGLDAVAEPVCRLRIRDHRRYQDAWRVDEGDGWIGEESAALLLDLPDGLREFITVPVMFIPEALARVVEWVPRPVPPGPPLRVPSSVPEGLVSPDPASREQAAYRLTNATAAATMPAGFEGSPRRAAEQLLAGLRRYWEAVMSWEPAPGAVAERALRVFDSDSGMWLVEPEAMEVTLRPVTPTALWRAAVLLLPRENELA